MQIADITCLYKGKGEKNDLENDRGIFGLPRIKQIIEKIIYNEVYPTIDSNMSDSNAGARQHRNIRDHLFIVYGVINSVLKDKKKPIDIHIYDIKQCFDKLGLKESLNDLWDSGIQDEYLPLLYELNKELKILVKNVLILAKMSTFTKIVSTFPHCHILMTCFS